MKTKERDEESESKQKNEKEKKQTLFQCDAVASLIPIKNGESIVRSKKIKGQPKRNDCLLYIFAVIIQFSSNSVVNIAISYHCTQY